MLSRILTLHEGSAPMLSGYK